MNYHLKLFFCPFLLLQKVSLTCFVCLSHTIFHHLTLDISRQIAFYFFSLKCSACGLQGNADSWVTLNISLTFVEQQKHSFCPVRRTTGQHHSQNTGAHLTTAGQQGPDGMFRIHPFHCYHGNDIAGALRVRLKPLDLLRGTV